MRPLGKLLAIPFVFFNINPILIIGIGFIFQLIGILFIVSHYFLLGIIFFTLGIVFDNVDGITAFALKKNNAWGRVLDETRDMLAKIFLWLAISFLLFEESIDKNIPLIFSYISLFIPIFELLSFHISDRNKVYLCELSNNMEKDILNEMKIDAKKIYSNGIKIKILSFLKYFAISLFFLWNSLFYPLLFSSLIMGYLHIFVSISFIFGICFVFFEASRTFFYNKIILGKYPL